MMGAEMIVPPLFRCPISLDLFKDPVTLCTGQTYDRSFIQKWLSSGNSTCPVTMQKLDDTSMVPNNALRRLIGEWLYSNAGIHGGDCLDFSETTCVSVAEIKQIVESDESTLEDKVRVIGTVHSLSQELPLKNSCLIKLDFFGILLELVFRNGEVLRFEEDLGLVEKALSCALKLMPFSQMGPLNMLKQEQKYATFLLLFEKGNVLIKKSLCLIVEAISSCQETKELCEKIGNSTKLVQTIADTIQHGSDAVEGGIRALLALSLTESNRKNIATHLTVEVLIPHLMNASKIKKRSLAAMAMATIENLLSVGSAKDAVLNHPSGVKAMVKMVFRVSDHEGSESAVNALIVVCEDSKSGREKAIVEGVLTQLLLLLQSQCNARTKTKARMLLKLLRSMWNEDPKNVL